jgi:hypothetical protein
MFIFIKKFTKVVHVLDIEFAKKDVQPTLYAYNDIKIATQDFHLNMKIGQGSFGVVYKVCTTFFDYIFALY